MSASKKPVLKAKAGAPRAKLVRETEAQKLRRANDMIEKLHKEVKQLAIETGRTLARFS